ncbi:hypothetical protein BGW36DRAFT_357421 [Talaromyces proteolyticus]|uniref:SnoaL-like domain-containing protein n=1 Tax=Talaromyces proteolyticus TaxID=1131652 RepID=A0AAD4PY54_9EURO|nr:uncharacterized protein BGW36DRAFT_357421 [Talaromyces proteolyticus]KAH8700775.1 hypothetical protein BGW36DRAFT_357421 [Talaromyces proteolyticus]
MATQQTRPPLTHSDLCVLAHKYFQAVDTRDIDTIVSFFAPDAMLRVYTDNVTYHGAVEIRGMFTGFVNNSKTIFHDIKNIIVDPVTRRVAIEQRYTGELIDGTRNDMDNCNFFDVDEDGKFTRVLIWMSGTNPLK